MPLIPVPHAPGVSLWVEEAGQGPRTLVLLGGASQTTAHWRSHQRVWQASHRVVCYDARGQGRSEAPDGPMTLDDHVADLGAVLAALGVRDPVLVGFSHGARVALAAAAAWGQGVSGLCLTATGAGPDALREAIVESWRQVLRLGGLEAMSWCALPDILGRRYLEGLGGRLGPLVRASVQRNRREGLLGLLEGMRSYPDGLEDAGRVVCPSLLVTADEDLLVSGASAGLLAEALGGSHVRLTGVGHTVPIEAPEAWRALVEAWLAGL